MAAEATAARESSDRELVITRIFEAPRDVVYKVWCEPEHQAGWAGPRGFTVVSCEMDVRPGGSYRMHMRSPEGTDHHVVGVYREIFKPERIVYTWAWADAEGRPTRPETLLTVSFEDLGAQTRLTLHQAVFESVTARDMHRGGWSSSMDCFAEYLDRVKAEHAEL